MAVKAVNGRMTVQVDAETHRALVAYSEMTDIPLGKVLARAVREWMNTTGHVHMEVMTGKAGAPLVASPDALPPMNAIAHARQG